MRFEIWHDFNGGMSRVAALEKCEERFGTGRLLFLLFAFSVRYGDIINYILTGILTLKGWLQSSSPLKPMLYFKACPYLTDYRLIHGSLQSTKSIYRFQ